jgi:hypothetical protein
LDFCQGDSFSEQPTGEVSGEMFGEEFAGVIIHEENCTTAYPDLVLGKSKFL